MVEQYFKHFKQRDDLAFDFFYISQEKAVDNAFLENLKENLLISYRALEQYQFHLREASEEKIKDYVRDYVIPQDISGVDRNVRQGDWGEILAGLMVSKFQDLSIPINKLRWKVNKNKSVFGTDLIAFNNGETITDIHYYEIKTRLYSHKKEGAQPHYGYISILAHNSLLKDNNAPSEMLADFLMRYYIDRNQFDMAAKFSDIVQNPSKYNRKFELFFIVEENKYTDKIFEELNDLPPQLDPLRVTVIIIKDLQKLIDDTWSDIELRLVNLIIP